MSMKEYYDSEVWNDQQELYKKYYPEHCTDSYTCWCNPDVEIMDNGERLLIHKEIKEVARLREALEEKEVNYKKG